MPPNTRANFRAIIRFDDKGRSYEEVGLKPIGGTTDVRSFGLTGHLVKRARKQKQPASEK